MSLIDPSLPNTKLMDVQRNEPNLCKVSWCCNCSDDIKGVVAIKES
jgi:hypothetical protein